MKDKFAVSMFGQKRLSREGGIEIVVKELCTRMAQDGCQVTCYNRSGHHVSGAEYDDKIESMQRDQLFSRGCQRCLEKELWLPFMVLTGNAKNGNQDSDLNSFDRAKRMP